jgi:hypothetical protein
MYDLLEALDEFDEHERPAPAAGGEAAAGAAVEPVDELELPVWFIRLG